MEETLDNKLFTCPGCGPVEICLIHGEWANKNLYMDTRCPVSNVIIQNNIITGFSDAPVRTVYGGSTWNGLVAQTNIFWDNGTNAIVLTGITATNVTSDGGIISDPLFLSSSDFHLQSAFMVVALATMLVPPFSPRNGHGARAPARLTGRWPPRTCWPPLPHFVLMFAPPLAPPPIAPSPCG